jgi:hypothetical protein
MIAQWQNVDSASADGDYPIMMLLFWFWIVLLGQYFQNTLWKIYDSFVIIIPEEILKMFWKYHPRGTMR